MCNGIIIIPLKTARNSLVGIIVCGKLKLTSYHLSRMVYYAYKILLFSAQHLSTYRTRIQEYPVRHLEFW